MSCYYNTHKYHLFQVAHAERSLCIFVVLRCDKVPEQDTQSHCLQSSYTSKKRGKLENEIENS